MPPSQNGNWSVRFHWLPFNFFDGRYNSGIASMMSMRRVRMSSSHQEMGFQPAASMMAKRRLSRSMAPGSVWK